MTISQTIPASVGRMLELEAQIRVLRAEADDIRAQLTEELGPEGYQDHRVTVKKVPQIGYDTVDSNRLTQLLRAYLPDELVDLLVSMATRRVQRRAHIKVTLHSCDGVRCLGPQPKAPALATQDVSEPGELSICGRCDGGGHHGGCRDCDGRGWVTDRRSSV